MSHLYEVALYGEFFAKDLKPILNRLTLHSETCKYVYLIGVESNVQADVVLLITATEMHTREVVFEPLDAQIQRSQGSEPIFLRCSKELLEPKSGW